jgi:hypothetical protein
VQLPQDKDMMAEDDGDEDEDERDAVHRRRRSTFVYDGEEETKDEEMDTATPPSDEATEVPSKSLPPLPSPPVSSGCGPKRQRFLKLDCEAGPDTTFFFTTLLFCSVVKTHIQLITASQYTVHCNPNLTHTPSRVSEQPTNPYLSEVAKRSNTQAWVDDVSSALEKYRADLKSGVNPFASAFPLWKNEKFLAATMTKQLVRRVSYADVGCIGRAAVAPESFLAAAAAAQTMVRRGSYADVGRAATIAPAAPAAAAAAAETGARAAAAAAAALRVAVAHADVDAMEEAGGTSLRMVEEGGEKLKSAEEVVDAARREAMATGYWTPGAAAPAEAGRAAEEDEPATANTKRLKTGEGLLSKALSSKAAAAAATTAKTIAPTDYEQSVRGGTNRGGAVGPKNNVPSSTAFASDDPFLIAAAGAAAAHRGDQRARSLMLGGGCTSCELS